MSPSQIPLPTLPMHTETHPHMSMGGGSMFVSCCKWHIVEHQCILILNTIQSKKVRLCLKTLLLLWSNTCFIDSYSKPGKMFTHGKHEKNCNHQKKKRKKMFVFVWNQGPTCEIFAYVSCEDLYAYINKTMSIPIVAWHGQTTSQLNTEN